MANARNFQYPEQYAPGISDEDVLSARQSQVSGNVTPWTYSNTGISHTVILPANTNPTIDGSLLSAGDYIGIFYDSTGTRACAGFEEWTGTGPLAITAFGDDPTTSAKDGLASGETLQWKIWRKSNGISYTARSSYVSPGGMGGIVTDSSKFNANGISAVASLVGSVTTVGSNTAPTDLSLMQNYPNPFNPNTMITFGLPERSEVRLVVYSVLGEIVAELADGVFNAGYHTVQFNGERLASGVYYYRLQTSTTVRTRQMLLMR
jgi:hypothetical protein